MHQNKELDGVCRVAKVGVTQEKVKDVQIMMMKK